MDKFNRDTRGKHKFNNSKKHFRNNKYKYSKNSENNEEQLSNNELKQIAEDTLKIINTGMYIDIDEVEHNIEDLIKLSKDTNIEYDPSMTPIKLNSTEEFETEFEIQQESTLQGCYRLHLEDKKNILVLNFASAETPDGFLHGSYTQEESLVISSSLYNNLKDCNMYQINTENENKYIYSHNIVYSPNVPVFRDNDGDLIDPYCVSFISCPAVNAGGAIKNKITLQEINTTMYDRLDRLFSVAAYHQPDVFVLGSWGCGILKNDINIVVNYMMKLLTTKYAGVFKQVTFSLSSENNYNIYDSAIDYYFS